jgi:hypothetical protein
MGEVTVVLLGALAVAGALLIASGIYARHRMTLGIGTGILLAVVGAWILGLWGIMLGVAASALILRSRPRHTPGNGT